MPGTLDLFDFVDLTANSESSPRNAAIDTLQIHHSTTLSYAALRSLMDPGGRTVSANGGGTPDGKIGEVVRLDRRAFTSASSFDNRCLTVEQCNVTLHPTWGIAESARVRLARLAVGMYRAGLLKHLGRGAGGIIGHSEVPGTYPTACPGPDMHLDHISALAQAFYAAGDTGKAGGGTTVAAPPPLPLWARLDKEITDMLFLLKINDGESRYGGGTLYAVTGPGYWYEVKTAEAANNLAKRFGDAANVTYIEWEAAKRAAYADSVGNA